MRVIEHLCLTSERCYVQFNKKRSCANPPPPTILETTIFAAIAHTEQILITNRVKIATQIFINTKLVFLYLRSKATVLKHRLNRLQIKRGSE